MNLLSLGPCLTLPFSSIAIYIYYIFKLILAFTQKETKKELKKFGTKQ